MIIGSLSVVVVSKEEAYGFYSTYLAGDNARNSSLLAMITRRLLSYGATDPSGAGEQKVSEGEFEHMARAENNFKKCSDGDRQIREAIHDNIKLKIVGRQNFLQI